MTAAGGDEGRASVQDPLGDPLKDPLGGATFRGALRGLFRAALERLSADGVVGITAEELPGLVDQVRETADPKFGDYSGTMAMALAKRAGLKPRDVAVEIIRRLDVGDLFEIPAEPVGPGFINLRVRQDALARAVVAAVRDPRMGVAPVATPETIVIDFGGPNVAKPMHVGHIRSTVIGDALAKILEFRGHHTITDNHLGDWGTQFGMILWGWKHCRDGARFAADPTAELARLYRLVRKVADAKPEELARDPEAAALAARYPDTGREVLAETAKLHEGDSENRALWEQFMPFCRAEIDRIFSRLHVSFDHALGESFFQPMLAGVVAELMADPAVRARESRGAIGIFLNGEDAPPFLIRKADGAFLYATTDLATLKWRMEHWKPDRILYVVDSRQGPHFEQLFATAKLWGCGDRQRIDGVEFAHVAFGTVLGEDGKPFKTRAGDTVGLESLLDEGVERAGKMQHAGDKTQSADGRPQHVGTEGRVGMDAAEQRHVAEIVGMGAIKYADLSQNRTTDYVFSFDKMLQLTGNTAAYMQYAVARVEGIFSKGGVDCVALRQSVEGVSLSTPQERALALELVRFGEALEDVEIDYRPNVLTAWLYELAGCYSSFYDALPVLKAEGDERNSRLAVCDLTGRILRQGLELLGIGTVEKM
ncbi:MAG: arginine--tRNA ligase [Planctomycetia bacterium]|nr:arginine--tRNA ligase [Planctomycetia bacterium]